MKKIMFNDKYGLTEAVLKCFKTQTRRTCRESQLRSILHMPKNADRSFDEIVEGCTLDKASKYEVCLFAPYAKGDIVAIAQRYSDFVRGDNMEIHFFDLCKKQGLTINDIKASAGFKNKMFVKAELMPHHIQITDVRVEHLQDISEEDVLAEGFEHRIVNNGWGNMASHWEYQLHYFDGMGRDHDIAGFDHKTAYSYLIDNLNSHTWDKNPYVFVYQFKRID